VLFYLVSNSIVGFGSMIIKYSRSSQRVTFCTTPDRAPEGYLQGTCTTPDSCSVKEIRRKGIHKTILDNKPDRAGIKWLGRLVGQTYKYLSTKAFRWIDAVISHWSLLSRFYWINLTITMRWRWCWNRNRCLIFDCVLHSKFVISLFCKKMRND